MLVPINIEVLALSSSKNNCFVLVLFFFVIVSGADFFLHKNHLLMVIEIEITIDTFPQMKDQKKTILFWKTIKRAYLQGLSYL